ncbi:MAG: NUDIX domain-containing protein [Propionibacteriaceae bacterium]|jgi:8-oxo-dGTP pyrophosphatase MutT (NUDIX family)|nr:NUDIX domain-containing protein [Propionibacteriaceae bacterium]
MTELWDLLDADCRPTGEQVIRPGSADDGVHRFFQVGDFHQVVVGALFRGDQMLIQRRVDDKEVWPGLWDLTAGGSVVTGESSRLAMRRELNEEVGVDIDFGAYRPAMTVAHDRGFTDYFLADAPQSLSLADLRLQASEVQDARWASLDEIIELHAAGRFINYRPGFLEFIFALAGGNNVYGEVRHTERL